MLAAGDIHGALALILLLVGVVCVIGAAWVGFTRRDVVGAVILLLVGIVAIYLS
jgi:hypothetical protein